MFSKDRELCLLFFTKLFGPLLCPLLRAKQFGEKEEAKFTILAEHSLLTWDSGRNVVTIRYDAESNLPIWCTAPSFQAFQAFSAEFTNTHYCLPATVQQIPTETSNGPSGTNNDLAETRESPSYVKNKRKKRKRVESAIDETPVEPARNAPFPFDPKAENRSIQPPNIAAIDAMEPDHRQLLTVHQKLGHLPYAKIKLLAKQGVLPRSLANCREPKCAECMFGKQTRRPWRQTKTRNTIGKPPTHPGDVVSVDQLQSPTPGLIAQSKGYHTKDRFRFLWIMHLASATCTYNGQKQARRRSRPKSRSNDLHSPMA
jgi:hypothetical protein